MKRPLFLALAILALVFPAARQATADADVSIDYFYNNLNDGNWIQVADYGYCWQPNVATTNTDWRPYSDGSWAYTDVGWTWVSNEDFGWAVYHYGRWIRLADEGWVWVPGYEWGPAWVSWRTGGDYIGWAPLPPRAQHVEERRAITGHVDAEFDIGPAYYNFVDIRYIGDPELHGHIYAPTQNVTYIRETVNVTNITYNNSRVYNYGPDYNRLSRYSVRPIRRLQLERETNVNFQGPVQGREVTRVQGDKLMVAAPMTIKKAGKEAAPKAVKTKIDHPKIERGWSDIKDAKEKSQLEQKIKTENAKNVPPPKMQPNNQGAQGNAPVATPAPENVANGEQGKGRQGKRGENAGATPAATPATTPVPPPNVQPNKQGVQGSVPQTTAAPENAAQGEQGKGHHGKRGENAGATPGMIPAPEGQEKGNAHKGRHGAEATPSPHGEMIPGEPGDHGKARGHEKGGAPKNETPSPNEHQNRMAPQGQPGAETPAKEHGAHKNKEMTPPEQGSGQGAHQSAGENVPPAGHNNPEGHRHTHTAPGGPAEGGPPPNAGGKGQGQEHGHGGKQKGGEASPTPPQG